MLYAVVLSIVYFSSNKYSLDLWFMEHWQLNSSHGRCNIVSVLSWALLVHNLRAALNVGEKRQKRRSRIRHDTFIFVTSRCLLTFVNKSGTSICTHTKKTAIDYVSSPERQRCVQATKNVVYIVRQVKHGVPGVTDACEISHSWRFPGKTELIGHHCFCKMSKRYVGRM